MHPPTKKYVEDTMGPRLEFKIPPKLFFDLKIFSKQGFEVTFMWKKAWEVKMLFNRESTLDAITFSREKGEKRTKTFSIMWNRDFRLCGY